MTTKLFCITTFLTILCTQLSSAAESQKFDLDISSAAKIEVLANEFSSKEEEAIAHLKDALKSYYIVSKEDWTHKYNHVADSDASGTITWTDDDSKVWSWLVRPGGLATVTDENGITTYLAKVVN